MTNNQQSRPDDYLLSLESKGLRKWLINHKDARPGHHDEEREVVLPAGDTPSEARIQCLGYSLDNVSLFEFMPTGEVNVYSTQKE